MSSTKALLMSSPFFPGRGVFAERIFNAGEFLLDYEGDHVTAAEGDRRSEN
jgi:hypothetical protein